MTPTTSDVDLSTADGIVVVDMPAGLTSHTVVARIRRLAGTRKVGHAGTLDPMATGVLVVGLNRAKDVRRAIPLIKARGRLNLAQLEDESIDLRSLTASAQPKS